jgi:PAS domain S-box-containing protein
MQFLFWVPTAFSLILMAVLWHVYQENHQFRKNKKKRHQVLESMNCASGKERSSRQIEMTDKNKTEENLRGYLTILDTLINNIPNPIYFKDDDGFYRGCNKSFANNVLGISRAEIIGRRSQDLSAQIPSELAALYQLNERKMRMKGGVHSFEVEVPCCGGIRREFLFSIAPVNDDDGHGIGSVGVMLDLTEKNRAARDRYQKEKLQGVLETAGAVCHEMNQPLQAIMGYTEIALSNISSENPTFLNLTRISEQIDRMVEITRKLQSITRYETMDYDGKTKIIDIHKASAG